MIKVIKVGLFFVGMIALGMLSSRLSFGSSSLYNVIESSLHTGSVVDFGFGLNRNTVGQVEGLCSHLGLS